MPNLYLTSVEDYPYATANAFNLWTLLGGQPVKDSNIFFILSYKTWGTILFLICIGIAFAYLLKKRKSDFAMYFASFFILSSAFTFITRMHERYLLPAIIFLQFASCGKSGWQYFDGFECMCYCQPLVHI